MNGLWVLVPFLLLWDSYARLSQAASQAPYPIDSGSPSSAPSSFWWMVGALSLVLYLILVPAVLFSAKGVPVSR